MKLLTLILSTLHKTIIQIINLIFLNINYCEYHNSEYEVFDVVPNNVLYGIDGDLYFIDTQIRIRS